MMGFEPSGAGSASSTTLQMQARGVIAETCNLAACNAAAIPTAGNANGTLVLGLVGLPAATVVTNIVCGVTVASAALTFAKMGIFSATGTFLGATAEFSGTLNGATGFIQQPLTAPVTVGSAAGYYLAFLNWGNASTGAQLIKGTATATLAAVEGMQLGTFARAHGAVLTQTDISANVTIANANTATIGVWLACS